MPEITGNSEVISQGTTLLVGEGIYTAKGQDIRNLTTLNKQQKKAALFVLNPSATGDETVTAIMADKKEWSGTAGMLEKCFGRVYAIKDEGTITIDQFELCL